MDFATELFMLLEQNEETSEECFISKEPLENVYYKLSCGHTFNVKPLKEEYKHQKHNFTYSVYCTNQEIFCFNCPYCRQNVEKKIKEYKVCKSCSFILVRGKRKGEPCGCKEFKDGYCKRHFMMKQT